MRARIRLSRSDRGEVRHEGWRRGRGKKRRRVEVEDLGYRKKTKEEEKGKVGGKEERPEEDKNGRGRELGMKINGFTGEKEPTITRWMEE